MEIWNLMSSAMLNFLAIIADLYSPLLLILCLALCLYQWRKGLRFYAIRLLAIAVASYTAMFIDHWLNLWGHLGLDFSTHTATSLGMVLFLAAWGSKKLGCALLGSLLAYCWIMYVENYHSWADMVSTAVVMSAVFFAVFKLTDKLTRNSHR